MDFNTLRQFVTIAEQESLSRAAEILNLTQGTLSRRLAELERELGAHLFTRTGRGVVPTTAGRQLLDHARKMLLNHQSAVDAVRGLRDPEAGRITVGMPPSLCELLTVPLYEKFRSRFPKASLSIVQGLSEELYLHILSNRIDLAIMRNPPVSPNVAIELLAKEPLGLLGRKPVGLRRDRVTLAQLAQIPLILPNVPDVTRPILEAIMARAGLTVRVALETGSAPAMFALATAGFGYAVIPMSSHALVPGLRRASWQRLAAPELVASLAIVTAARAPKTAPFVDIADILKRLLLNALKRSGVHS